MELMQIGVDTSKHVFTVHGVDANGAAVLRRDLRRGAFETFMSKLAPTEVALEACGGSHHWARRLAAMGHRVRLIPPQYVKPYVKRSKTDRADAEAICEAAGRPSMRFVSVKTAERQGELMVLRTRELLVRQRTQAANALRGQATEFGLVVPLGVSRIEELLAKLSADPAVPTTADQGAVSNIPPKRTRRWKSCFSPVLYRGRNAIEYMFSCPKNFRRNATRYDRIAANFLSAIYFAATVSYWL